MNKIYCFSNAGGGGGMAYAMGDDGAVLGSHWCSHEGYISFDLAVDPDGRSDRHIHYKKHFPNGYEMEFVPAKDIDTHQGLQKAIKLNQEGATKEPDKDQMASVKIVWRDEK